MTHRAEENVLTRLQYLLAGRYRVEHELGRGAMARVYLASDLKHDRQVAIKVLHPELAGQLGAERFLREIRLTASLQHPHILPLYDSGDGDGLIYYITSYVEGESLRARLLRERVLPADEALTMIRTIALALDYAHRHGVVHRDIKPENILLQDGQPVLADFGIALALSHATDDRMTGTGISLGTPQYMSPEQATGAKEIGVQSDIYSLGAVAYEMLVGEPPITGPTREAILSRIVVEPPRPIRPVRSTVPPEIERAILEALAKNPVDRFRTAASFAFAIEEGSRARAVGTSGILPHRISTRTIAVSIIALGFIAAAVITVRPHPLRPLPVWRQLTFSGDVVLAAISPDGRSIAYSTRTPSRVNILVSDVRGGVPDTIASLQEAYTLEWSPDGSRILIGGHREAVVVSRYGGVIRHIEAATRFPAYVLAHWLPDGLRVSLHNFSSKEVTVINIETEEAFVLPVDGVYTWMGEGAWSLSGEVFAVGTESSNPARWTIRVARREGPSEAVLEDSVPIGNPQWSDDGSFLYFTRGESSIERIFISGRRRGNIEVVQSNVEARPRGDLEVGRISITIDGRDVVLVRGAEHSNLMYIEAGGASNATERPLTSGTARRWSPVVSPDGEWVAYVQEGLGGSELARIPVTGGPAQIITHGANAYPRGRIAWSPRGDELAFTSGRAEGLQVVVANVNTGRLRAFPHASVSASRWSLAWSPGLRIAYQRPDNHSIHLLDAESGGDYPVISDSGFFFAPQFSPDGGRLAIFWNRHGGDKGLFLLGIDDSTRRRLLDSAETARRSAGPFPIGWSPDGRYVLAMAGRRILRIDSRSVQPEETIAVRSIGGGLCAPGGPLRPNAFVCAFSDVKADVWMIENFAATPQ